MYKPKRLYSMLSVEDMNEGLRQLRESPRLRSILSDTDNDRLDPAYLELRSTGQRSRVINEVREIRSAIKGDEYQKVRQELMELAPNHAGKILATTGDATQLKAVVDILKGRDDQASYEELRIIGGMTRPRRS